MILLARRFDNTETVNTAEKEISRPYRVRVKRDQAEHVKLEASTNEKFKLFVNEGYWENRKDHIEKLREYYVSTYYF